MSRAATISDIENYFDAGGFLADLKPEEAEPGPDRPVRHVSDALDR